VHDDRGRRLGRVDLAYPERLLGIEYDGEYHRTPEQFEKDGARLERFHLAGWRTIHVRSRGLFVERAATLTRIHRALRDAGASLPELRL
jgi:very-short-patch-repair endonuclease